SNRYWPTTPHSKLGLVAIECTIETVITSTITAATHRPTWRTGTALISPAADSAASGSLGGRVITARALTQERAPLSAGCVSAPACTPHVFRIDAYFPLLIRSFSAARI